jgi:hypothetical protein
LITISGKERRLSLIVVTKEVTMKETFRAFRFPVRASDPGHRVDSAGDFRDRID